MLQDRWSVLQEKSGDGCVLTRLHLQACSLTGEGAIVLSVTISQVTLSGEQRAFGEIGGVGLVPVCSHGASLVMGSLPWIFQQIFQQISGALMCGP